MELYYFILYDFYLFKKKNKKYNKYNKEKKIDFISLYLISNRYYIHVFSYWFIINIYLSVSH